MANSIQNAEPTLASLLDLFKGNVMMEMNCHQVGEIVSFDSSTQTAEVRIKMLKMQNGVIKDFPILIDCPCVVLGGGEGRVTFPIKQGDSCLVLFNDRDIDNWYAGGQKMLPRTERKHSFSDAIALVGVRNLQNKITDYFTDGVELKYGNSSIKLKDGYIDIKGNVNIVQNTIDDNSLHSYIISSSNDADGWCRVYSDGWCEQGGYSTSAQVIFKKEMASANYTLLTTSYRGGQPYVTAFSTTGFTKALDSNETFWWEVKGFIK